MPETRPGIQFDADGVCMPCRNTTDLKAGVDWQARRAEIEAIAKWGRENSQNGYDCIIGVSGGKDSTRQALLARDELGLNPLLVSSTYPPRQQNDIGPANLSNLISLGFNCLSISLSPQTWAKAMRLAFFEYGNWCKSTELALYTSSARVAVSMGVPLILLGENNAVVYGDTSMGADGGDASRIRHNNTLGGGDTAWLENEEIGPEKLMWYAYPGEQEMDAAKLRMIFLGYYFSDFDIMTNAKIALEKGLHVRDNDPEKYGTLNNFEDLDEDFVPVNQYLKFLKFGFSRVTDEVCELIRQGDLSREDGIELIKKYDGRCSDELTSRFCDFIGISVDEFWSVAEKYRNPDIWERDNCEGWVLMRDF